MRAVMFNAQQGNPTMIRALRNGEACAIASRETAGSVQRLQSVAKNRRPECSAADFAALRFRPYGALIGLLDHTVGPLEHLGRHRDADVPRRLEVHD